MPRPTPDPHPAEAFIDTHYPRRTGLSTRKKYAAIWRRMETSKQEPRAWLREQVDSLDGTQEHALKTTIGVLRSAILYYLRWKHHRHTGELLTDEEVAVLGKQLPATAEGDKGTTRTALSEDNLEKYNEAVNKLQVHPQIITVLLLLPYTGLRIFEACGLRVKDVVKRGNTWKLSIVGKGKKHRFVQLNNTSKVMLQPYIAGKKDDDDFLFSNPYYGIVPWSTRLDLSPAQVRAVVREHLQPMEELTDVVPHVLRHQFASFLSKNKVSVFTAKELLGHSSVATLERYNHPDEDMLQSAVDLIEKQIEHRGA